MKMKIKETALKFSTPLVIVGALFLASCGGGGGDAPTQPAPEPTPQERCAAAGNVWDNGTCKTAEQIRQEGRDAVEGEQARKAAEAMAKALRPILGNSSVAVGTEVPSGTTPSGDVVTALGKATKADDGMGSEKRLKSWRQTPWDR